MTAPFLLEFANAFGVRDSEAYSWTKETALVKYINASAVDQKKQRSAIYPMRTAQAEETEFVGSIKAYANGVC